MLPFLSHLPIHCTIFFSRLGNIFLSFSTLGRLTFNDSHSDIMLDVEHVGLEEAEPIHS